MSSSALKWPTRCSASISSRSQIVPSAKPISSMPVSASEEVVRDPHRVDQEAIVALELEDEIVALVDQREVLRPDAGADRITRSMSPVASELGDHVGRAVDTRTGSCRSRTRRAVGRCRSRRRSGRHRPPPMKVSAKTEPTSISMSTSVSPSASPARPLPSDRSTVTASSRLRVVRDVESAASIEHVGATAAAQNVVRRIATDRVVMEGAKDDLDPVERVALSVAAAGGTIGHVDDDTFGRQRIGRDVDAGAA